MKTLRYTVALMFLAVTPLSAQRGCFHSPEAPTDILLLVGSAGLLAGSKLRRRK